MSEKSSAGFAGLVVEGAVIGLVVALLPKLPLGPLTAGVHAAQERPSLASEPADFRAPSLASPAPLANWRTAVSRSETTLTLPPPAATDPAYVERRLDQAGQRLVSGVASYLSQHAEQVFDPPPSERSRPTVFSTSNSPVNLREMRKLSPPANSFRYGG